MANYSLRSHKQTKHQSFIHWFYRHLSVLSLLCLAMTTEAKVTIVYTSNQPNILINKNIAHFPQLSTLLKTLRSDKTADTLFLHGGDSFSPSAMSLFDNANNIIALANMMDVSLYSVGKRELTYDVDVLSLRAHDAQFPIISSNVLDLRSNSLIEGLFSTYNFDVDGINISVASIINPRVLVAYAPQFAELINMDSAFKEIAFKQKDADLKILMTDLEANASFEIAKKYDFDLILVAIDGPDRVEVVNNTKVVLGGGQDGDTVIIQFDPEHNEKLVVSIESLDQYRPDPLILSFIDKYRNRLGLLYQEKIAVATDKFTTKKSLIRTRETALSNVFTDAIRAQTQTQIAILNNGSIRNSAEYPVGHDFTRGDIQSEFPFGGHHVTVEISGGIILKMLENSVSRIKFEDGRFLSVSGMQVVYNSKHPFGSRIKSVTIAGEPLALSKIYNMAMPDFYLRGGDDYQMLENLKITSNIFNKRRTWHIVADYFLKQKNIHAPILNRMLDLAKNEN